MTAPTTDSPSATPATGSPGAGGAGGSFLRQPRAVWAVAFEVEAEALGDLG
ncbi:hypothetical protein [Nocardioides sp. YIM 152588]|uniref:hypothetical protein n=1 Tax=Nocardioides sp. YIM 152588 TaxID=3158259 RepID=UPI0032E4D4D7